jgi:hypothetical protein
MLGETSALLLDRYKGDLRRLRIDGWNDRKHPFIWTKTAEDVLAKIKRKRISTTDH